MATGVIDEFELIQVEKHDRECLVPASGGFERLGELFVETGPVWQLGEDVEIGQSVDALDGAGALGRVLDRAGEADDVARGVAQWLTQHMDVKEFGSRRMDPDVDPVERGAARQPDHPAAKGSAIIGVNDTQDRRQTREKLLRIDA